MSATEDFPIAIIRCQIGMTVREGGSGSRPTWPSARSFRDVLGPGGRWSALAGWAAAHYGYLDLSRSALIPGIYSIPADALVGDPIEVGGKVVAYKSSRKKLGNRAIRLASARASRLWRKRKFKGVVVVYQTRADEQEVGLDAAMKVSGTYRGLPIRAFGGVGATGALSGGLLGCLVRPESSLHYISHEIGHVLGFDHSWGIKGSNWGNPPWNYHGEYGDPYCVMGGPRAFGRSPNIDFLSADPPAEDWPAATFDIAGPAPAVAAVHRVRPQALQENQSVTHISYDEWHSNRRGTELRLYPAANRYSRKTKLVVLHGRGGKEGSEKSGTFYIEYRTSHRMDSYLARDPSDKSLTCPAVVIHELRETHVCREPTNENRSLPACRARDGSSQKAGRRENVGLKLHFRARVPVPPPLSRDWRSRSSPVVRVTNVGRDSAWVDVSIGRPARRRRRIRLTGPAHRVLSRELAASKVIPGRMWEKVSERFTLEVSVSGYGGRHGPIGNNPRVTWLVKGEGDSREEVVHAPAGGAAYVEGKVRPMVTVRRFIDSTDSSPQSNWKATITYRAYKDGRLTLRSDPTDGNYKLSVRAAAEDTEVGRSATQDSRPVEISVNGHAVRRVES